MDVILSSGFLAFARHIGVFDAIDECGIQVEGICGTSSGSMVGALYAAGYTPDQIAEELYIPRPITMVNVSWKPWEGFFCMNSVQEKLKKLLPERVEELPKPMGIGLCTMDRKKHLCTNGSLVDAIIASCAVPYLFVPHSVDGHLYRDGGFADRLMAEDWRTHRKDKEAIIHIVDRSNGVAEEVGTEGGLIIRTPRSFAKLWDIGDFEGQRLEAKNIALQILRTALDI
jgi:predicted acylesterase/phospholipase RssA